MSFRLTNCDYLFTGAYNGTGDTNSDPIAVTFQELGSGTGLDFRVTLNELVSAIQGPGSETLVTFMATVIDDDEVSWNMNFNPGPGLCVTVVVEGNPVPFEIDSLTTRYHLMLSSRECAPDPLERLTGGQSITGVQVGGDADNKLYGVGYLLCQRNTGFLSQVELTNMQLVAYGGSVRKIMGNVNGDCVIDDTDLAIVLEAFGTDDANADVDGSGLVDDTDLAIVLTNFGMSGC